MARFTVKFPGEVARFQSALLDQRRIDGTYNEGRGDKSFDGTVQSVVAEGTGKNRTWIVTIREANASDSGE